MFELLNLDGVCDFESVASHWIVDKCDDVNKIICSAMFVVFVEVA